MESAKPTHTPGPWTYGPKNEDGHRFIFGPDETPDHNESGEPVIAELWDALDPISEADARLIAAAPDYDAMARALVADVDQALKPGSPSTFMDLVALLSKHRKAARAAILKAEGK